MPDPTPTPAPSPAPPAPATWHHADHAPLVTAKGWKGPDDTLKSYADLEKFVGAPPERLIRLPEKPEQIDDAFRADVLKRINYQAPGAPAKIEEYGVKALGEDGGYMTAILTEAQKLGITPAQMQGLAAINAKFFEQSQAATAAAEAEEGKTWDARRSAVDAKLKERFGDKYDATMELMTREAGRLGYKPEELEGVQKALALMGDDGEAQLLRFNSLLADIAEVRREAPFHRDGNTAILSADQAQAQLNAKRADPAWAAKALQHGTPEAQENIRLNLIITGKNPTPEEVERLAKGLAPTISG